MATFTLFIISGLAILAILLAKRHEVRNRETTFILVAISKSDEHMRRLSHTTLRFYAEGKHKTAFFITKQLPLKAKGYGTKATVFIREKWEERFGNVRDERVIAKPENISEFFKSIKEVEKGQGEIREEAFQAEIFAAEQAPEPIEAPAKKRAPRRKKLPVVEAL